jgi:cytoskeletal protein CcmA (bactofilin family)
MGRNNTNMKPETLQQTESSNSEANKIGQQFGFSPQTSDSPPFRSAGNDTALGSSRVFTDSEGMTRDIKEGRLSGFIGSGTSLTGETEFKSMLRVDGHLVGKVSSESGTLLIGSGGMVDANISVAAAVVHGTINGDIIASEKIELGRTAKVIGNIQTPSLIMEQGAILEGNCNMMQAKSNFDKRGAVQNVAETVREERETTFVSKTEPVIAKSENGEAVLLS